MEPPSTPQFPPIPSEEPSFSANNDFGGLFGLEDAEGSPMVDNFGTIHSVAGDDLSEVAVALQDFDWDDSSTGVPGSRFLSLGEGLERSWRNIPLAPPPKLPWQQGVWPSVFGKKQLLEFKKFQRPLVVPNPCSFEAESSEPQTKRRAVPKADTWQEVVSSLDVETWHDARDALLDRAFKRWVMLLDGLPATFELVTQLNEQPDMQHKIRLVRDVFAGKAPQTLLKRCNSLTKYTEFLKESCIAFPGSEQTLYRFLDELRMQGAKSSKLQSVIEAIRFITYVVGAEEVTRDLLSKRCIGVPRSVPKSQRGQASPFSVVELAELHAVLADCSQDEWDRVFCGSMLAAVYTRSRWSDLQHAVHILLDPDEMNPRYIEFHIKEHKTKAANLWTAGMLTAVGPAIGVVDDSWVIHWL